MKSSENHFDVVVVGAGLSGIGAAYHLQNSCPDRTFTVLEGRDAIGGTWDLFKYPGIRSDSDMYTFGFPFHPWKDPKAIADGPAIMEYLNDTVDTYGLRKHIQFGKRVAASDWSSTDKKWTLTVSDSHSGESQTITCNFLFMCSGYYDYKAGYEPDFPNVEAFEGIKIHPQHWDTSLDYANKKIVIIGSGATAVTLLPILAETAKEVTMLQRSPTYIANRPSEDKVANTLKKVLPKQLAHTLSRWKNILFQLGTYNFSRNRPNLVRNFLLGEVKKSLKDKYNEKDWTPNYNPWDQRICAVPDGDLFESIKAGKSKVLTDTIKSFVKDGIELNSGKKLDADIIITATGLKVQLFGGMKVIVDGTPLDFSKSPAFKGVMLSDIPNFAFAVGYTNASWTLKSDLNCIYVTKVLNHLKKNNLQVCTPKFDHENMEQEELLDFDAGYILRAKHLLPKQGAKAPWKVHQNYIKDLFALKYSSVRDKDLEFV
ncbi:NAD(P)/FAD-dependent oxidoreductase [Flavobacteriales bacterium]|nr:NAD(P)/FAD-dependent oxidoreductase [Flavobacteriales bacterium]